MQFIIHKMVMIYGMMMNHYLTELRNWKKHLIWTGSGRGDIGYPDGLMAGKEVSAQEGFNKGFKESVFVGQTWGLVRGVTSALACLPDALKERFVETEDKRNKLQHLHESVSAMSTTDALKLFHHHCLNNRLTEQEENTQTSPQRGYLHGQCPDENILENYIQEFNSLVPEYSAIKVSRMSIKTVI